ncbi:Cell division control protein 2 [Sesamum angolense]|uniref:cyclin-dependent kinase n=1 Tax=Sesamum angolense TaxID=2727404 RepID=A0AAE1XGM2_9LAMI|nr:Cell division control protein 2 [Sesamum angolense]
MDLYTRRRCIGYGASGEIYSGFHSDTHEPVLLREVRLHGERDGIPTNLIREISFLQEIEHQNILRLLDVTYYDTENGICLVYESLGRELRNISSISEIGIDPDSVKKYLQQILRALAFLHSHKTVHHDLRPENVFVDIDTKHLKVADLALCRALGSSFEEDISKPTRIRFMAPELLMNSTDYSYETDIWSVGCIFAQMLTGMPLFDGSTVLHILAKAFRYLGIPTEEMWPGVTAMYPLLPYHKNSDGQELREMLPDLEPEGFDLLLKMLCVAPGRRITAKAALKHPYFNA